MRDYGIDGAWLQQFVVDLPGGPAAARYPSRLRVLRRVAESAKSTGRVWALSYDISGMPAGKIFDTLAADWKKMVDDKTTAGDRYLHHRGRPVVQVWGFYRNSRGNSLTADVANRLIDFFKAPGPYSAFMLGGGDWDWRKNPDPQWQAIYRRLDAYAPWNVGNHVTDSSGAKHAATDYWADDQRERQRHGTVWIPVVYPGFSWDNLQRKPPGTSLIPRRGGEFLWEQFHTLVALKPTSVYVAMFDEVDEGTAIFKVTSSPPTQAHFVGYEGRPSDYYLRLVGAGARMLYRGAPVTATIPIRP